MGTLFRRQAVVLGNRSWSDVNITLTSLGNHGGTHNVSCAWQNRTAQTIGHCKGSVQTGNCECHFKEEQPLVAGDGDNYPH